MAPNAKFSFVGTLPEIEAAIQALPENQQRELLQRLSVRLAARLGNPLHQQMEDGCGIVETDIPDLATNKEHLRQYGH